MYIFLDVILNTAIKQDTIPPGITRDSILQIAKSLGYQVTEGPISLDTAFSCDEMFACGTGVGVAPVGRLVAGDREK